MPGAGFQKGSVVAESICTPLFEEKYSKKFFFKYVVKSVLKTKFFFRRSGAYIVAYDEWSENYFHWLTDAVPRLYMCRALLAGSTLILPENFTASYHAYTLRKFNINNIEWTNDAKTLFVKNVILPTHVSAPGGYYNPEITRNAIDFLTMGMSKKFNKGGKLYISRQRAAARKVINEDEVIDYLQTKGFAIIYCEELSFEEQVSIFSHAKILISTHGAGLANLMFMPAESSILELRKFDDSDQYNCFFRLAHVFHHKYFYQVCRHQENSERNRYDIHVNIDVLKTNLELLAPHF